MSIRTSSGELASAAEAALGAAMRAVGGSVRASRDDAGRDLVVVTPDGRDVRVDVKVAAVVTPETVRRWIPPASPGATVMVVGDLVTEAAKELLRDNGFGWLDRRGHIRLTAPGVWLDASVPASPRQQVVDPGGRSVRGASGLAAACAAMLWPEAHIGVRELARLVGLSPSAISKARSGLMESGLLADDGRPAVPELFWATVPVWTVSRIPLTRIPQSDDTSLLVVTGIRAAAALNAPVVATEAQVVELLAPDEATFHRVRLRAGEGPAQGAPALLGIAPTSLAVDMDTVSDASVAGWPVAHPLFVALELGQDAGRGAESLESWSPTGAHRVW